MVTQTRRLAVMGVPTSAGAFAPGQETAPAALRGAGLLERLAATGLDVVDRGDSETWRWRPDAERPNAQNLEAVAAIARETAARVRTARDAGEVPLVLGGDCTIEIGTVLGHLPSSESLGLLYFDLHPDLNVPARPGPGALDWMGVAHLLGEELAAPELSRIGPRFPLLDDESLLLFAWGPDQARPWEHDVIARRGLAGIPVDEVAADPEGAAGRALEHLGGRAARVLVHFDVDVIDFTTLPLSENAGRNEGLAFEVAMRALGTLMRDERIAALTVTEVNPAHGAEDGSTLSRFADQLAASLRA
jgi:arginase